MSNLLDYFKTENDTTRAWILEDPKNRGATLYP